MECTDCRTRCNDMIEIYDSLDRCPCCDSRDLIVDPRRGMFWCVKCNNFGVIRVSTSRSTDTPESI